MSEILRKLPALFCIGMPGLQRLLLVLVVQWSLGLEALGRLNSDLSIVQILAFFSAVGWCTLIMVRLPIATKAEQPSVIANLVRLALPVHFIGLVILIIASKFGYIVNLNGSITLFFSWSSYQFVRHVSLALKQYFKLIVIDVLALTGMIVLMLPSLQFFAGQAYFAFALPLLGIALASIVRLLLSRSARQVFLQPVKEVGLFVKGLEFGSTNFFSGGMLLILAPLILQLAGESYAGLYGLIAGVLNILALVPRALAVYYLPDLAKKLKQGKHELRKMMKHYRQRLSGALVFLFFLILTAWFFGHSKLLASEAELAGTHSIFSLMLIVLFFSQLALPDANLLMVREESRFQLQLNAAVFFAFAIGALLVLILHLSTPANLLVLLCIQLVAVLVRWGVQLRASVRFLKESTC